MTAPALAANVWVFDFLEGSRDMRQLLGGKGANVAEMTRILGPDLVPPGFTITTEACVAYMDAGRALPAGLAFELAEALTRLEEQAGKRLGDAADPLLVTWKALLEVGKSVEPALPVTKAFPRKSTAIALPWSSWPPPR